MGRALCTLAAVLLLAGCASQSAAQPTATRPTPEATAAPSATARALPTATQTVRVDGTYLSFVRSLCGSLAGGNAAGITSSLMYYQYNSGLRWGMMGDGEGQTADPGLVGTWLAHARPRCVSYTSGSGGHGALLTSGWEQPGPAGIVEMDVVNGHWKINDFTFGPEHALAQAMQVGQPVLPYHA